MFENKCVWSALYPISNHSHIRQLQFGTHAFSQQVLQQAVLAYAFAYAIKQTPYAFVAKIILCIYLLYDIVKIR